MTNREWLESLSNHSLGEEFCEKVAQDGSYCAVCPFRKLCVDGESGFKVWLGKERKKGE